MNIARNRPHLSIFFGVLILLLLGTTTIFAQGAPTQTSKISLFNGKDLFGWKSETQHADWQVIDGEIQVTRGDVGLLRTTSQFDQFVLELDFYVEQGSNSGVFLRTSPRPTQPGIDCYELNLAPDNPFPTGSFVGQVKSRETFAPDAWHQLKIIATADRIQSWIDGKPTATVRQGPKGRGYIGLQKNKGIARFRNIQLQPLGLTPLTKEGWTDERLAPATAKWNDGVLTLSGGLGQLESRQSFGDFLFQTRFRTLAPTSNSGVFFRCIPGDQMMGYESQIQFHEPGKSDGAQELSPPEWPAGSIFRRQRARASSAKHGEWCEMTIIATGPHFAIWLNGELVTQWTDRRKKNVNPRRGLRLDAGTIILQGHDPQTSLQFENMNARELNSRKRGTP